MTVPAALNAADQGLLADHAYHPPAILDASTDARVVVIDLDADRIPDDEYNSLLASFDVVFAAYEDFPGSSNTLTKASTTARWSRENLGRFMAPHSPRL